MVYVAAYAQRWCSEMRIESEISRKEDYGCKPCIVP
jgi:hypothetical protein